MLGLIMKNLSKILLLLLIPNFSFAQNYSLAFDSLTQDYISQLPIYQQGKFNEILKSRKKEKISKRISSLSFDYCFIEERYCFYNSKSTLTERYFDRNDSIPIAMYVKGKKKNVKDEYSGFFIWYSKNVTYNYTLSPLIDSYSRLKQIQKLPYSKRQIWPHACVVNNNDEKEFAKKRKKELETTYQIQTMIDKVNLKIIVSIQIAPKNPKFNIFGYNGVWDW
jgi:hypothetical protein